VCFLPSYLTSAKIVERLLRHYGQWLAISYFTRVQAMCLYCSCNGLFRVFGSYYSSAVTVGPYPSVL
jgi:hypothetical protein